MARPTAQQRACLQARYFAEASLSAQTRHCYASDLRHFLNHGGSIPAKPKIVAQYLACHAGKLSVATLRRRLAAIHWAHGEHSHPSPVHTEIVKRTFQGIRRTHGMPQRQVRAIVKDDLLQLVFNISNRGDLKATRDTALLLLGFAGAFRRCELVALRIEDLRHCRDGIEVQLHRSKTDQEGRGRTIFIPKAQGIQCPVGALKRWLTQASIQAGPIFRPVSREGRVGEGSLSPQSVALVIKEAARRVGGEEVAAQVAGHSLRAGYCTEADSRGYAAFQIRQQTGHTSDAGLAPYLRPATRKTAPSLL